MPVIIIFLGAFVTACWAWRYEHQAAHILHPPALGSTGPGPTTAPFLSVVRPQPAAPSGLVPVEPIPPTTVGMTGLTVEPVETVPVAGPHGCNSVLGWEAFAATSVLALDGTVLVGCRRLDKHADEIRTMVLRVGHDERSARATAMLDRWRMRGTSVRLRPTAVAGVIELYEGDRAILRAPLLVA